MAMQQRKEVHEKKHDEGKCKCIEQGNYLFSMTVFFYCHNDQQREGGLDCGQYLGRVG
jgi:hypothetical protein